MFVDWMVYSAEVRHLLMDMLKTQPMLLAERVLAFWRETVEIMEQFAIFGLPVQESERSFVRAAYTDFLRELLGPCCKVKHSV